MKEDVGTSKPKKYVNNVERLTWDPKLNKPLPYTAIKKNTKSCSYVGVYGSGLLILDICPILFTSFLSFDISISSIFI